MEIIALSLLMFAVALQPCVSQANDVVTEQYVASAALHDLENAKAQHEADLEQVRLYKQRLAADRKQLAAAEKKAALSKKRYLKAKEMFDQRGTALEQQWKK